MNMALFSTNETEFLVENGDPQWTLCVTSNRIIPFKFDPCLLEEDQEWVIAEIAAAVKRAKEEM